MDNRKPISVKMNGKETFLQADSKPKKKDTWNETFKEQAAAIDKSFNPEDLIEYEKTEHTDEDDWFSQLQSKPKKKKSKIPPGFKMFGIAAASAALIGVTLGFIMLRMFVGIDNGGEAAQGVATIPSDGTTASASEDGQATSKTAYTTEPLSALLIQGGVYSSTDQAKAMQESFTNAGFTSMVWERDGEFRIFVGAGATEQQLDSLEASLIDSGLEIYAGKAWQTEAKEVNVGSQKEVEWLGSFPEHWQAAIAMSPTDVSAEISTWQEWLEKTPEGASEPVKELQTAGKAFVTDVSEGATENVIQIHLLTMWNIYQNLGEE